VDYGKRTFPDGKPKGWASSGFKLESYRLEKESTVSDFRYRLEKKTGMSIFIVEWVRYGRGKIGEVYSDGDVAHVELEEHMMTD